MKITRAVNSDIELGVIPVSNIPELGERSKGMIEKMGIKKVIRAQSAHGKVVYLWGFSWGMAAMGIANLNGDWTLGMWKDGINVDKIPDRDNGWSDLFPRYQNIEQFKSELEGNKFIYSNSDQRDEEAYKIADIFNNQKAYR